MQNDFNVIIRIQDQDVFDQFVDAPDAKSALEKAVAVALTRDVSKIKGNYEIWEARNWGKGR